MAILKERFNIWLATGGMGIAGLLHLWIVPEHWEHAPSHGIVFLLLGIAQLVWPIFLLRRNSPAVQKFGIILAAGSIFLWVLTITFTAPFEDGPEEMDATGIVVKLFELASIVGLVGMLGLTLGGRVRALRVAGIQVILAFFIALAAYSAGRAAEPLFPVLKGQEHHNH